MPSLYDSFTGRPWDQPTLYGVQEASAHKTHTSGSSTAASTPPRFGVDIPVDYWTDLASRLCLDPKAGDLRKGAGVEKETLIDGFKSEADVVNAATLYLSNPVHRAYQLVHPEDKCLNEVYHHKANETTLDPELGSARVDRAYFKGEPSNKVKPGSSKNIFALMEYKKHGTIDRSQFARAIAHSAQQFIELDDDAPFINPDNPADAPNRDPNHIILMKQATHYAVKYKTRFVALCDFNTLLLLVMAKTERNLVGGRYAYMTIVKDPKDMRKAYLGFLLAARGEADTDTTKRFLDRNDRDVFQKARDWDNNDNPFGPATNSPRRGRNPNPIHDSPQNSQGSDVSMTGMQRGGAPQIVTAKKPGPGNGGAGDRGRAVSHARDSSASSSASSRSTGTVSSTATSASRSSATSSAGGSGRKVSHSTNAAAIARNVTTNSTAHSPAAGSGPPKNKVAPTKTTLTERPKVSAIKK